MHECALIFVEGEGGGRLSFHRLNDVVGVAGNRCAGKAWGLGLSSSAGVTLDLGFVRARLPCRVEVLLVCWLLDWIRALRTVC